MCAAMVVQVAFGQAAAPADAGVSFAAYDVVSVKPVAAGGKMMMIGMRTTPDGIDAENVTLGMLVRNAYGGPLKLPTDDSVTGLPDWAKGDFFSVQAKMSPEQVAVFAKLDKDAQEERREAMLQALLADRFKLKVHREPKTVPDYELVAAKGGPKLKESGDANPNGPKDRDGKPIAGSFLTMGNGKMTAQGIGMPGLANFLGQPMIGVGRVVVDKTGLTGKYNFTLNFSPPQGFKFGPNAGAPPPPGQEDEGASIFTALQEDLGLKLQPGTTTIDTVVVEHVDRPVAD
jgi:uncharacterized protein (TIGR03435 family)